MTRTLRRSALLSLLLAAALPAHAYDGQISFTGQLTDSTCHIKGGDSKNVTLPTISTSALKDADSWAGRTPFSVTLAGCDANQVGLYFEPTIDVDTNGNLMVSGGAIGVALRLRNGANDAMDLRGDSVTAQNGQLVSASGDEYNHHYFVEYYSSAGNAMPGAVQATTYFTIVYP